MLPRPRFLLVCLPLVATIACRPAPGLVVAKTSPSFLRVLVDADTANEVDDLFAIVRALNEPSFTVVGLTGAQYVTQPKAPPDSAERSHRLNQRLLAAMGRQDLPMAAGSNTPMPDALTPQDSPAVRLIIGKARETAPGETLNVVTLGALTNIASAILIAPDIVPHVTVWAIMLRYTQPPNSTTGTWQRNEFNADNDQHAVDTLFATLGLRLHVMTATASEPLIFYRPAVDQRLAPADDVGAFLLRHWDDYVPGMTWTNHLWIEKRGWHMWDVALVEALANPSLATEESVPAPAPLSGGAQGRMVNVFTRIDVAAMEAAFWARVPLRSSAPSSASAR